MKKLLLKSVAAAAIFLSAFAFTGCGTYYGATNDGGGYYEDYAYNNPVWGPSYYMGTRYYYFPDIEAYYDLATRDFIFLNNGQWLFVQSLSPFYSSFDLYNSFIIVINRGVYQPWMHHQYYNSHYPRYYYIDYYDYSNIPYVRGFNENQKGAIYWPENQRNRARTWDDRNIRNNRRFTYSEADRRVQQETTRQVNAERASRTDVNRTGTVNRTTTDVNRNTTTRTTTDQNRTATSTRTTTTDQNRTATSRTTTAPRTDTGTNTRTSTQTNRRTSDTNYYGEPIGRPVRVEPQMRNTESTRSSAGTRTSSGTTTTPERSNTGTRSGR